MNLTYEQEDSALYRVVNGYNEVTVGSFLKLKVLPIKDTDGKRDTCLPQRTPNVRWYSHKYTAPLDTRGYCLYLRSGGHLPVMRCHPLGIHKGVVSIVTKGVNSRHPWVVITKPGSYPSGSIIRWQLPVMSCELRPVPGTQTLRGMQIRFDS